MGPGSGLPAEDNDVDLAVADAPGVCLVAAVDRPGPAPDRLPLVVVGLAGGGGDAPVLVGDLGARLGVQVVIPARRARLPEMGADDRDVVAERHPEQRRRARLAAAGSGGGDR